MRLKLLILGVLLVCFILFYSRSEEETKKITYSTGGVVSSYTPEQLKITTRIDVGQVREYTFAIASDTRITGIVREGGWVSVVYTQYRFGARLLMTAVAIIGENG